MSRHRNRGDDEAILQQIEELIRTSADETPSHIFTLTPWISSQLVERYNAGEVPGPDGEWHNRTRKPAKIREFAADMTDGEWKLTGDTIKFSNRGRLRDGQNRLFACVRSSKSFRTHIVFGIDDAVFPWMDRGKPRDGADALHILGIENANLVQGAVRWLELFRLGRVKERDSFTPSQILDAFHTYDREKLRAAIALARRVYQVDKTPPSTATALAYIFGAVAEDLRDRFFEAWATGSYPAPMGPLQKCLESIQRDKQHSSRPHDVVRAAKLVIAWNNVILRKKRVPLAEFDWRLNENFPEVRGR